MLYCKAPFGSFVLRGSKFGCCCSTTLKKEEGKNISYNTSYINEIREGILSGNLLDVCKSCGSQDSYNLISDDTVHRNVALYVMNKDVSIIDSIQISVGNTCNNLCMTCSSINNMSYDKKKKYRLEDFDLSNINSNYMEDVKHISFIGGETLLYPKKIICILKMFNNLETISIVTNGSILSYELIEFINGNDINVSLIISIDGYKELHENIRTLSVYDNVVENINIYSESKANILINITYSILNCLDLKKTINELDSRLTNDVLITLVQLLNPSMLSVRNLSDDIKEKSLKVLNDSYNNTYSNITIDKSSYETIVRLLSCDNEVYLDGNIISDKVKLFDENYNSNSIEIIREEILSMCPNNITYSNYKENKDIPFIYEWWDVSR